MLDVTGNLLDSKGTRMVESLDIWGRDPVEIVADLIGNPAFAEGMSFEPNMEVVGDENLSTPPEEDPDYFANIDELTANRVFTDFKNTKWWWRVQVS